MPCCHCQNASDRPRRRSFLGTLFTLVILYALTVFTGGTLINTGHPLAVEVGHIMQIVTLVEPATHLAYEAGLEPVGNALDFLAGGAPVPHVAAIVG